MADVMLCQTDRTVDTSPFQILDNVDLIAFQTDDVVSRTAFHAVEIPILMPSHTVRAVLKSPFQIPDSVDLIAFHTEDVVLLIAFQAVVIAW